MKKFTTMLMMLLLTLAPVGSAAAATISCSNPSPIPIVYRGALTSANTATPFIDWTQLRTLCPTLVYTLPNTPGVTVRVYRYPGSWTTVKPAPAPTPAPAPAPTTPTTPVQSSAMQTEMLSYLNAARVEAGVTPLILDQKLCDGAALKSKDMAVNGYFSHTSPTYGSPFDMMKSLGITYRAAGENIAKNTSVKGAHTAFMNSSGHRANILNAEFKKVGLGFYQDGPYLYVTQWFTN